MARKCGQFAARPSRFLTAFAIVHGASSGGSRSISNFASIDVVQGPRFKRILSDYRGKLRQQIKDEDALPIIASRCDAPKKAYCPKRYIGDATQIENYFCR